ncbi:ABC transporter ATP-binding protein OS=Streptomyces fumanus OX=67302 GN=GCM10018772_35590 PE=4 SV=1 [Streptomyces fumanus]
MVLKYVAAAGERGLGVVLITHNPHHDAYLVGDHFSVLRLGTLELATRGCRGASGRPSGAG